MTYPEPSVNRAKPFKGRDRARMASAEKGVRRKINGIEWPGPAVPSGSRARSYSEDCSRKVRYSPADDLNGNARQGARATSEGS